MIVDGSEYAKSCACEQTLRVLARLGDAPPDVRHASITVACSFGRGQSAAKGPRCCEARLDTPLDTAAPSYRTVIRVSHMAVALSPAEASAGAGARPAASR